MNGQPDRMAILEALLFVAEEPLALSKLQEILSDADAAETEASVRDLALRHEADGRGIMVQEVAGGFRLATRPEVHPWVQRLQQVKPARLSRAALETLAIIAYRQPITRAEIEAVRGVAVDGVLRTLLERELVRMMGRKTEAGRPMLYGTSQQFLEHFGLRELGDLPTLREINELIGSAESGARADTPTEGDQFGAESSQPGAGPSSTDGEPTVPPGATDVAAATDAAPVEGRPTESVSRAADAGEAGPSADEASQQAAR